MKTKKNLISEVLIFTLFIGGAIYFINTEGDLGDKILILLLIACPLFHLFFHHGHHNKEENHDS